MNASDALDKEWESLTLDRHQLLVMSSNPCFFILFVFVTGVMGDPFRVKNRQNFHFHSLARKRRNTFNSSRE